MINFLTNLMLDDHCRVILEGKPGDEGSDYINASFIDVSCDVFTINNIICVVHTLRAIIRKQHTLSPKVHCKIPVVISGE